SPDGRSLLVANSGYARPTISIVDLQNQIVRDAIVLDHAWLGMAWHPDGRRLFVSGAANNTVHELRWSGGRLSRAADFVLGRAMDPPADGAGRPEPVPQSFIG